MLKKLTLALASGLFCSSLMAANKDISASIDYDLAPKVPTVITNITFGTLRGECLFNLDEDSALVNVKVLTRSGEINGQPVSEGAEFNVVVRNGTKMSITAKPAARVQLINHSNSVIHAHCHTTT